MIEPFKRVVRRHWPRLRLRTILLLTFVFVAALPGFGALFLRVYENTLVRQTEAELIAQGSALAAAASIAWTPITKSVPRLAEPETPTLDLRLTPILPAPPPVRPDRRRPVPAALAWADRLRPVLHLTTATTRTAILLLDARGQVLAGRSAGGSLAFLPEVRAALASRAMTTLRRNPDYRRQYPLEWLSRASDLRIYHARPVIANSRVIGVLLLSHDPRALFVGLYADRGKIALGIILIFATLVILSGLLSRGIVRPIEALGEATRAVAGGGGVVPQSPTTAAIEIQALYRDFGIMAEAIERRSRYLRDFAHAVSHEFKTPLSGIGGAIELLRDHSDMDPVDRERFLANIGSDATRLNLLVTRLLDLARADMAAAVEGMAIDLGPAIRRAADAFASGRLAVSIDILDAAIVVPVPPAVIESVVASLIENSHQAGAKHVAISAAMVGDHAELRVEDDGGGIPPGDRHRIFEPFFTSRRTSGGTGLGLPIARSLLLAHRGTILLEDGPRAGTCFRVTLPIVG